MTEIDKVARWLRKTQGRDKLCKIFQYLCRLVAAYYKERSQYYHLIYHTLSQAIRQARKLFRLFKSVDQYVTIKKLMFYGEEGFGTIMQLTYRTCYMIYWIIDNLSVIAKIKILSANWKLLHVLSLRIRFVAMTISLISNVYHLRCQNLSERDKKNTVLKMVRDIADYMPIGKDSTLLWWVDERAAGVGGMLAALISTYMIWNE